MNICRLVPLLVLAPALPAQECEVRLQGFDLTGADNQGASLSLSGSVLVSGAPDQNGAGGESDAGAVYINLQNVITGAWSDGPRLQPGSLAAESRFGASVSLDGNILAVGAPSESSPAASELGAAYIYTTADGGLSWSLIDVLVPADIEVNDLFGASVAVSGSRIFVGAPDQDGAVANTGAIYIYELQAGSVVQVQKVTLAAPDSNDRLGEAIAADGEHLIAGLRFRSSGATFSGVAATFRRDQGLYVQEQEFSPSDASIADFFGFSVAISGDYAVVGSVADDDAGSSSGSAYVFENQGGVWLEEAKLVGSALQASDAMGSSVAIDGARVAVGVPGADGGEAYVFGLSGGAWVEERRVRSLLATPSHQAGAAVQLEGDLLAMGNPTDSKPVFQNGAVVLVDTSLLDADGDGRSDLCVGWGSSVCGPAVPNSSGNSGVIDVEGSPFALDAHLKLRVSGLPSFQFAYFLASQTPGFVPNPGGSQGNLCLGGAIGRFTAQVGGTTSTGLYSIILNASKLPAPLPMSFSAGETWSFQCWFRDSNPGPTSNFTDAFQYTFL